MQHTPPQTARPSRHSSYIHLVTLKAMAGVFLFFLPLASLYAATGGNGTQTLSVAASSSPQKHTPSRTAQVESGTTPEVTRTQPLIVPNSTLSTHGSKTQSGTAQTSVTTSATTQQLVAGDTLGPNLIQNPSLETPGSTGLPAGWKKGGYGTNQRTLTYPATPAQDGADAARVTIDSYTSGDAKWYFDDVPVESGARYQFSDYFFSNVSTSIDARFTMQDGTFKYLHLASPAASASYQNAVAEFTAPVGAVSATVFHVIQSTGSLTTDNFSLQKITSSAQNSNLISNGNFETTGSTGLPAGWKQGGWGTNTRTFTYPVSGVGGSKAARVDVSSYQSGSADWYYSPVPVTSGVYTYEEDYLSNSSSVLEVAFYNSNGTITYKDAAFLQPTSSFTHAKLGIAVGSGVSSMIVYHLIAGAGNLTIDNASLIKDTSTTAGIFSTGAVTLRFDDNWLSQYQNAVPLLNQYGFKGTFYVVSQQIADTGFPGYMSKAQIQQVYQSGHEIGAHTRTHPQLSQLTAAQQQQEIQGSRQDLQGWNVGPINTFAYPFGDYNATTIQIVKDSGFSSAAASIGGNVTPSSDHYQLERKSVEINTTPTQIKQWIDDAVATHTWLILTIHRVDPNDTDQYTTTPDTLNQVLAYLAQKNVPVVTISQGVADMNP